MGATVSNVLEKIVPMLLVIVSSSSVHHRQMPCKRLQPSHRSSANLLTLVPAGTTEYIVDGDSQAAFAFPTEIRRDFDLQ